MGSMAIDTLNIELFSRDGTRTEEGEKDVDRKLTLV